MRDVHTDIAGHTAVVELRRPPSNHFDTALITQLADTYEALDRDRSCRAIVLCSQGRHFCAGADFSRSDAVLDDASELYSQALRLFRCRTPVVAAVQGAAIGGGSAWHSPPTSGSVARAHDSPPTSAAWASTRASASQ